MVPITGRSSAQRPRARSESLDPSSTTSLFAFTQTPERPHPFQTPSTSLIKPSSTTPATYSTTSTSTPRPIYISTRILRPVKPWIWRWLILTLAVGLSIYSLHQLYLHSSPNAYYDLEGQHILLRPHGSRNQAPGETAREWRWKTTTRKKKHDPEQWLRENSYPDLFDDGASGGGEDGSGDSARRARFGNAASARRPRAAIISLVRNEELDGILQSMRQLELHWNRAFGYPWIFFNEKPFSDEFKAATTNATSSRTEYHLVPRAHWSTPAWISRTRYMDSLDYLGTIGVGKGHMLSYHAMIRWQSGFFYEHPALASYDWYWRVEPDVHFFCDVPYDPFRLLAENDLVYGFNMAILDDARSFASLWSVTRDFIAKYPELVHPDADLDWLLDPHNGMEYNNCQFFSNFEIGSLAFWRGEANRKFFEHLDQSGGFFYERYGDAPVHTLSLALFVRKDQVWFFRDIGYQHDTARHCPPPPPPPPPSNDDNHRGRHHYERRCTCEPTGLDENFYKLVPMESPQVKPRDTCIRLWLGGDWLDTKPGWSQDVERAFGGDGYGGYVLDGLSS